MRIVAITVVLAFVLGTPGAVSGSEEARCADVRVPLRMFKIEAKWQDPSVSVGDVAKLKIAVSRTAEEDPVTDDGEPYPTGRPMNEPAEGVELGIYLIVGDYFLTGAGLSDASGKAVAKIRIEPYVEPGRGVPGVYGEKLITPENFPSPSCRVLVFEWGYLPQGPKLTVTR